MHGLRSGLCKNGKMALQLRSRKRDHLLDAENPRADDNVLRPRDSAH